MEKRWRLVDWWELRLITQRRCEREEEKTVNRTVTTAPVRDPTVHACAARTRGTDAVPDRETGTGGRRISVKKGIPFPGPRPRCLRQRRDPIVFYQSTRAPTHRKA